MYMESFSIHPLNAHYEGQYEDGEFEWRRICSIDKAANLLALLGSRNIGSVLEVGCGTGAVLAEVRRLGIGIRHVGIDMADPHEHLDPAAESLEIYKYDGTTLPFADNSFDLVIASHVIEHVLDPRRFLSEMKRVAANLMYVEVPCELHIRADRNSLQRTLDIGHINAYTPESFVLLIQTSDLQLLDVRVFDHSLEVQSFHTSIAAAKVKKAIRSSLLRLTPRLASRLFCYHCGVLCGAA